MAKREVIARYVSVAVAHEIIPAKSEGKSPQVMVTCRAVEGPEAGKEFKVWMSLSEKAAEYTAKTLRTMGWKCNDITALEGLGAVKFDANAYNDEYPAGSGKTSVKYDIWPHKERATLREDDRQSFAARFKALAAATPVATISEANAAPTTLPPARETGNGASAPTGNTGGVADPSNLFQ